MKNLNFKLLALIMVASLSFSSCAVHNRDYNRRPPRHDNRDRHDHGDDRRHDDHY